MASSIQAGVIGPSGRDIVTGPDCKTWMLFHMWTLGAYRALGLAFLEWEGDAPSIRELTREPMPAPESGP